MPASISRNLHKGGGVYPLIVESEVMPEEMPVASVPSVALSGSAKMGLTRVDDNTSKDPESDNIKTVVEYEVKFSSEGLTDGGLQFGASISIDEDGKGAAGSNGVNAASVFIGSADGTWKLQFGSNDPGIDLVGNVGLADADEISGMTKTVLPLFYTDGTTKFRMGFGRLSADDAGEKGTATLETQVLMDGASGQAAAVERGYATYVHPQLLGTTPVSYIKQKDVTGAIKYHSGPGKPLQTNTAKDKIQFGVSGKNMPAPPPGRAAIALTGTISSHSYALTAGEGGSDAWSAGVKYNVGAISVGVGIDSNDVWAFGVGGTLAGFTGKATYVKQDGEMYYAFVDADVKGTADDSRDGAITFAKDNTVNEMEAWGLSVSREIGQGSSVALTYSRLEDKGRKDKVPPNPFIGTKQWELDFTYDLGGGASFYAGIEQADKSVFNGTYDVAIPAAAAADNLLRPLYTPVIKKSKVTTLEAGITMKF